MVVRSVDTMKESRDAASSNRITPAQIQHTCELIATMNVTHITVDTQYDYPDFMRTWVQAVRATGKKVWFRGNWNNWEGNNQQPADLCPKDYTAKTAAFIESNREMFEDDDIFDPCAEPENGPFWKRNYGQNWTGNQAANIAFNDFILQSSRACAKAFDSLGVKVETGIRSTNGWIASQPSVLFQETVEELGYVSMDFYPGNDVTLSADEALEKFIHEFMPVYNVRNVPIVIAEFGYSIKERVSNEKQLEVLQKWFDFMVTIPNIVGINYWVGPGYAGPDSSTADCIFEGTTGNWRLRPAGEALKTMYKSIEQRSADNKLPGVELDTHNLKMLAKVKSE